MFTLVGAGVVPLALTPINAAAAPQPTGGYSQSIEIQGGKRLLFVSGQIPETPSGAVPKTFEEQARLVWSNLIAQLHAANMTVENLVKVTTYLSSREYADLNGTVRRQALGSHAPAITVIIAGIYSETWLVEIEAIAAA